MNGFVGRRRGSLSRDATDSLTTTATKTTRRPKASLDRCPLPTRLPRNQRGAAATPRPPERVRKYGLAGKPEALVSPRACVPSPARTSYTRSPSEDAGPRTRHSRVLGRRAPHPAAHAFWTGPAASRRGDGIGFWVFFFFFFLCSRPCSSHLPRTGARLSLGLLGVCDWPGLRSSQLGEAWRRAAGRAGSEASLRQCGVRGGHAAAGSAETAASASGYGRSPRRPGDPGGLVGFWNLPAPGGWGRGP